jgi:hypothetical protein
MQGKEKNLEFMRHPERWPRQSRMLNRPDAPKPAGSIFLKRYVNLNSDGSMDNMEFGMLFYYASSGHWLFAPEQGEYKKGDDTLLVTIVNNGWMVD